jgi:hypothetical protein
VLMIELGPMDEDYVELTFTDIDDYTKVTVECPESRSEGFIENLGSMGYEFSYKNWRE